MIMCPPSGSHKEYMYYNGKTYLNGTKFTLNDSYIENWTYQGKKIWKYAYFSGTFNNQNGLHYYFVRDKFTIDDVKKFTGLKPGTKEFREFQMSYSPVVVVRPWELSLVIEEITQPRMLSEAEEKARMDAIMQFVEHPNNDWDHPEMRIAWVVYIVAMIGSLIFTQFYILWAIATWVFYKYRKGIMG